MGRHGAEPGGPRGGPLRGPRLAAAGRAEERVPLDRRLFEPALAATLTRRCGGTAGAAARRTGRARPARGQPAGLRRPGSAAGRASPRRASRATRRGVGRRRARAAPRVPGCSRRG